MLSVFREFALCGFWNMFSLRPRAEMFSVMSDRSCELPPTGRAQEVPGRERTRVLTK